MSSSSDGQAPIKGGAIAEDEDQKAPIKSKKEKEDSSSDDDSQENWFDAMDHISDSEKRATGHSEYKNIISPLTELTFEGKKDGLSIKWTKVENMTKCVLQIEREDKNESTEKETKNHELLFLTHLYDWSAGETITAQLFTFDQSGEKHAATEVSQYVIGGPTAISQLCVEMNHESFTSVDLNWHAPKHKPEYYEVNCYKSVDNSFMSSKYTKETMVTMDGLASSTSYYFEVIAIYPDRRGTLVRSQKIKFRFDPNALRVEAFKCMQSRKIHVKWGNGTLDKNSISFYLVYLKSGEESKKIEEKRVEKQNDEVYFEKLKSDTNYVAYVETIGNNDKVTSISTSCPVSTNKSHRNFEFDIFTQGKAVINSCTAVLKNEQLESSLSWSPADLGQESDNFDCIQVRAFIKNIEKGKEKRPLEIQDKIRAKPEILEFGKSYQFHITYLYRDLDNHTVKTATATEILHTDIGSPSHLDVHCVNKEIKASWRQGKGATKHTLSIFNENMESVKEETVSKRSFLKCPVERAIGFGKKCIFVVKAYAENGKEASTKKKVIIGGYNAVTDVVAKVSSLRKITVTWTPPKNPTHKYRVRLYEDSPKRKVAEKDISVEDQCSHTFKNLKANTSYYSKILPNRHGKFKNGSQSDTINTGQGHRNFEFDIFTQGKAVINSCTAVLKNEQLESSLSWSPADLGQESDNFDCIQVEAFIKNIEKGKEKRPLEIQDKTRAKPEILEFGKSYQFDIAYCYLDLDNHMVTTTTATEILHTDIGSPSHLDVHCVNKEIKASWRQGKGATKHTLSIFNENMESVKEETVSKRSFLKCPVERAIGFGKKCIFVVKAYAENGKEASTKKKVIIGGDNAVTDVVAKVSSLRKITVTWQPPKNPTHNYRVRLYEDSPKRKVAEEDISAEDQCSHTFKNLKTNTSYYSKIFPNRHGKFQNGSQSDTINTGQGRRKLKFDIIISGKPAIQTCEALEENGKYKSLFKWEPPDIGEEANNYTTEKIEAFVTMKDKKPQQLVLETNYTEAKPISLRFGESYLFCVKCTYKDLDDEKCYESEDSCLLQTDIGTPVISAIKWRGSSITVEWKPAEGAVKHVLSVINDATKTIVHEILEIVQPHHIPMSDNCCYGMTCSFIIVATGGNQKNSKDEGKALIGGNNVCTEIIARKSLECPRRAVELTWNPPHDQPIGYKVQILECDKDSANKNYEEVEATFQSYTFENLKSETVYICKVCPVYKEGKIGYFSSSNQLQTDKSGDSAVMNVVLTKDESVPRRSVIVKWNPPENIADGYLVELYQVDENDKKVIKEQRTEDNIQTVKFTELKAATTYLCKVSPIYQKDVKDGTFSNPIKTDKRINLDIENWKDYGTPEKIADDSESNHRDDSSVELSWGRVIVGENHKTQKFHITVSEDGAEPKKIFDTVLPPGSKNVKILDVRSGQKYEVKFTTMVIDLDKNEIQKKTLTHLFYSKTDATNVSECETEKGLIVYKWKSVNGAKSYELLVKDEFLSERILLKKKIKDVELLINQIQEVRVEQSEQLRIGRTCMTKIIVYGNGPKSESDWKPHLIGGESVPRNVKANEYAANPERCIQVTFDAPKMGEADKYEVIPVPRSKIHKTGQIAKNSPFVVEYLHRGIEYSFQVSALHGEKWSETSLSNFLTTEKGGTSIMNITKSDETGMSGQVRDIRSRIVNEGDKDLLKLEWEIPTFGNNAPDYKVENYRVKIHKINESWNRSYHVGFVNGQHDYHLKEIELELGQIYEISISTKYIDIDEDEEYTSSAVKNTVMTRPSQPVITKNSVKNDKLTLEWNHCAGANHYVVNLFVDGSKYKVDKLENTVYERPFGDNFGFGKTYHVVIDAIGSDDKKNSFVSENIIIVPGIFSTYKRGERIGCGAYGDVYRVICPKSDETLGVVKEIKVRHERMKTTQDEIKILQELSHKNIVKYYYSTEDSDKIYIFMEYMPSSVKDEIEKNGAFSEQITCKYTKQIIEGLSYLHQRNILHRDIKAANVLQDGLGNVKLADFGISKKVETISSVSGRSFVGTAHWMSPEVIKGERYGQRADIWSVGCTVVEMLTKHPPLSDLNSFEVMFRIWESLTVPTLPDVVSNDCCEFIRIIFVESHERPTTKEISEHKWLNT